MRFFNKLLVAIIILISFSLLLTGCKDTGKTPGEPELVANGNSLKTALPPFKALSDNYMYKETIHQTNGEDWFIFSLVKINDSDIFCREKRFNHNAGWQYADTIFTDFEDLTEKDYTLYLKQSDNNYHEYRKFKYNDADEEFIKYYYTDNATYNINEKAEDQIFDFSFFEEESFEYFEISNDNNETVPCWRIKQNLLSDTTFKKALGRGVRQFDESVRLDYVYLFLADNKVSELHYGFYSHLTGNVDMIFHNKVSFHYDDYQFNASALSQGFELYVPE